MSQRGRSGTRVEGNFGFINGTVAHLQMPKGKGIYSHLANRIRFNWDEEKEPGAGTSKVNWKGQGAVLSCGAWRSPADLS